MPMMDMPLDELKKYQGRNPKPSDHHDYWDRALQELDAASLDFELVPSTFQTKQVACYDLYFTGVKGAKVHAKFLKPNKSEAKQLPAMLWFHGYRGSSGDWSQYLAYAAMGYVVAALDVRGQTGVSVDSNPVQGITCYGHIIRGLEDPNPDNLFYRQVFLDTAQLARIIFSLDYVNPDRVYTQGGSQGGALALVCAALEPRITKISAEHPFLSDYKRIWEIDLGSFAYEELRTFFREFDPCHERENEIFTKLGYIDIQHLVDRIKGEVLWVTGLMDDVCPPSSQFAAYNRITSPKRLMLYPDYRHEFLPKYADVTLQFFEKS